MQFKELADWFKFLEKNFSPEIMIPTLPVIIRLDGVSFSKYTSKLNKPFDDGLTNLMIETTKALAKETGAVISYTQSDEITLILYSSDRNSQIYHDGKKQKILSKLTAKCVNVFNEMRKKYLPNHDKIATFDCRIYQTPTLHDATLCLLWRENDATRNSKQALGYAHFSHKTLNNMNTDEIMDKLMLEKGINWNNLPVRNKRGTYIKTVKTLRPFTKEEISKLPPKHNVHTNPDLMIERNDIIEIEYPILNKIKNKVGVIFNNEEPITE